MTNSLVVFQANEAGQRTPSTGAVAATTAVAAGLKPPSTSDRRQTLASLLDDALVTSVAQLLSDSGVKEKIDTIAGLTGLLSVLRPVLHPDNQALVEQRVAAVQKTVDEAPAASNDLSSKDAARLAAMMGYIRDSFNDAAANPGCDAVIKLVCKSIAQLAARQTDAILRVVKVKAEEEAAALEKAQPHEVKERVSLLFDEADKGIDKNKRPVTPLDPSPVHFRTISVSENLRPEGIVKTAAVALEQHRAVVLKAEEVAKHHIGIAHSIAVRGAGSVDDVVVALSIVNAVLATVASLPSEVRYTVAELARQTVARLQSQYREMVSENAEREQNARVEVARTNVAQLGVRREQAGL